MSDETISTTELCRETRLSYRQIDYWVTNGLIRPRTEGPNPGSGNNRRFSVDYIPKLKLAKDIQSTMMARGSRTSLEFIREVLDHFHDGGIKLTEGVLIAWDVEAYK
jgi:DNA-binding transcriptional MerR regulator